MEEIEPRILLSVSWIDGIGEDDSGWSSDVGIDDIAGGYDPDASDPLDAGPGTDAAAAQPLNVVLIDGGLDDVDTLLRAQTEADRVIVYDSAAESAADVLARVTGLAEDTGQPIGSLAIYSHGTAGEFALGNETISQDNLDDTFEAWQSLGDALIDGGNIYLFGCNVGAEGTQLLDSIAKLSDADVFARRGGNDGFA